MKALIDKRDKRFRKDDLKARSEVIKRIKIEKTLFYGRKFASALDNRAKWKVVYYKNVIIFLLMSM